MSPPFKLGPPSNLGSPAIQGSKVHPLWPSPLFYILSEPPVMTKLFQQNYPNEIQDNIKNKLTWERRTLKNIKWFFIVNTFIRKTRLRLNLK